MKALLTLAFLILLHDSLATARPSIFGNVFPRKGLDSTESNVDRDQSAELDSSTEMDLLSSSFYSDFVQEMYESENISVESSSELAKLASSGSVVSYSSTSVGSDVSASFSTSSSVKASGIPSGSNEFASSGGYSKFASSGGSTELASSGGSTELASSGGTSTIASFGVASEVSDSSVKDGLDSASAEPVDSKDVVLGTRQPTIEAPNKQLSIKNIFAKSLEWMQDTYTLSIIVPITAGILFACAIITTCAICSCIRKKCRRRRFRKHVLPDAVKSLNPSDRARLLGDSSDDEF